MKRIVLPALTALALSGGAATAESEPLLGQIVTFAGTYCPSGWAVTNGQTMMIQFNMALFSLLGPRYGGNGTSTYALPRIGHMSAPNPTGGGGATMMTSCIAQEGTFPPRP